MRKTIFKTGLIALLATTPLAAADKHSHDHDHKKGESHSEKKQTMNPDISVNGIIDYYNSERGNKGGVGPQNGLRLRELELSFSSDVDSYFRGVATIGIHSHAEGGPTYYKGGHGADGGGDTSSHTNKDSDHDHDHDHDKDHDHDAGKDLDLAEDHDHDHGKEGHDEHGHAALELHIEELYVETIALSMASVKVGKFYSAFGKHNGLHTHAYPFIDAPLYVTNLLGEEGLNNLGAAVNFLVPTPWYMGLTLEALQGGIAGFNSVNPNDMIAVADLTNLFELSDTATFELGLSGAFGDTEENVSRRILGVNTTVKWRPSMLGRYSGFEATAEIVSSKDNENGAKEKAGWAFWAGYQIDRSWKIRARTQELGYWDDAIKDVQAKKHSLLVSYDFSEFSALRVQADSLKDIALKDETIDLSLQLSMSLGAHPAHGY